MATCPVCGEHLHNGHQCDRRILRRKRYQVLGMTTLVVAIGAIAGSTVVCLTNTEATIMWAAFGALVGGGIAIVLWNAEGGLV